MAGVTLHMIEGENEYEVNCRRGDEEDIVQGHVVAFSNADVD